MMAGHPGVIDRASTPLPDPYLPEAPTAAASNKAAAGRSASRRRERSHLATNRVAAPRAANEAVSSNNAGAWTSSDIVAEARRWIGGNPTSRRSLWCARFMNFVLRRSGHPGTGSDMARSFAHYGRRVPGPRVGAIAVIARGARGGHVGVVSGIDPHGNPILISGNHNNRVMEAVYPRRSVFAYVMPIN